MNAVRINGRDTKRIGDVRSILTALESYRDSAGKLPDNTDNDAGGWDIGNTRQGAGDTFCSRCATPGYWEPCRLRHILAPRLIQVFNISNTPMSSNCGGTYAILAVRLEGKKESYKVQNTLETCYTTNFNAVPVDAYWLAYMIREF